MTVSQSVFLFYDLERFMDYLLVLLNLGLFGVFLMIRLGSIGKKTTVLNSSQHFIIAGV